MYLEINLPNLISTIKIAIDSAVDEQALMGNVLSSLKIVFVFAFIIIFFMPLFNALISNEPLKMKEMVVKPAFYSLVFFYWQKILLIITTFTGHLGQTLINASNYDGLDTQVTNQINLILLQSKAQSETLLNKFLSNVTMGMTDIQQAIGEFFLQIMLSIGKFLDYAFIVLFTAYAEIILMILIIVSPIALVLTFFKGLNNTFISWLKSFISVNLWVGTASLIFVIINKLSLAFFQYVYESNTVGNNNPQGIYIAYQLAIVFVALGIFKGIMMFKVPGIISMFIGSSPSGGMFASAFAPIMVGLGVAKMGASAISKGMSGASGAGGSMKSK